MSWGLQPHRYAVGGRLPVPDCYSTFYGNLSRRQLSCAGSSSYAILALGPCKPSLHCSNLTYAPETGSTGDLNVGNGKRASMQPLAIGLGCGIWHEAQQALYARAACCAPFAGHR
mmetsp:Transcript_30870/g.80505  ORF Transcript_30870/g.80505 Transcript_30870/m.80505 type:complete len:115 (+) Transcript_30870:172-516(+)